MSYSPPSADEKQAVSLRSLWPRAGVQDASSGSRAGAWQRPPSNDALRCTFEGSVADIRSRPEASASFSLDAGDTPAGASRDTDNEQRSQLFPSAAAPAPTKGESSLHVRQQQGLKGSSTLQSQHHHTQLPPLGLPNASLFTPSHHDPAITAVSLYPSSSRGVFTSPVDDTPSHIASSPWSISALQSSSSLAAARTSPDMSALYGRSNTGNCKSGSSSNSGIAGPSSPRLYSSLSLTSEQRKNNAESSDGGGSTFAGTRNLHALSNVGEYRYDDDDDRAILPRDRLLLPRRNHTIASGAAAYRRRLDQHFQPQHQQHAPQQQLSSPLTSPSKNSLSAITGGREDADDDWEAMMARRESLLPARESEDDAREELDTTPWQPMRMTSSGHRRFPSQPTTTFATSPVDHSSTFSGSEAGRGVSHQRSESAHVGRLTEGPFASSPIVPGTGFGSSTGIIRRHQSLNYHAGRNMARMQQQHYGGTGFSSPAIPMQPTESAGSASRGSVTNLNEQAVDSSPAQSPIGTAGFLFSDRSQTHGVAPVHSDQVTSMQLSSSLLDAHSQLARMSLSSAVDKQSDMGASPALSRQRLPSLITNRDELARSAASTQHSVSKMGGPVSAAAYVPPIGHAHHRPTSSSNQALLDRPREGHEPGDLRNHPSTHRAPQSAFPVAYGGWTAPNAPPHGANGQREQASMPSRPSATFNDTMTAEVARRPASMNVNLQHSGQHRPPPMYPGGAIRQHFDPHFTATASHAAYGIGNASGATAFGNPFPPLAAQGFLQSGLPFPSGYSGVVNAVAGYAGPALQQTPGGGSDSGFEPGVRALITAKGYNPSTADFDVSPPKARFFVIKSFTEDDVQRSLKHEIWASTEKGNQRLDRAFQESDGEGPLYLLFSVNASGHFCGVAEMLTPLDYSADSTVWAQEGKWKGTFRVRWIYVKDVPNNRLRHLRLTNTAECKPITQSRDTQELPIDSGQQALKIIAEFPSRTTLLQDWMFNDHQQQSGQATATTKSSINADVRPT